MSADILIVDDEADIRMLLSGILEDEGYRVRTAHGDAEARRQVGLARPDLIFQDIWLQGSTADGIGLLEEYAQNIPNTPVVMMSGHGTIETAVRAIKQGAYDFVEKPFNTDRLLILIQRALETSALKAENAVLRQKAGEDTDLVGGSQVIQTLRQTVDRVAPTNSRLMISGPPGSGQGLARPHDAQPLTARGCSRSSRFRALSSMARKALPCCLATPAPASAHRCPA